jgi:CRP/FNR family transcriptional regulator
VAKATNLGVSTIPVHPPSGHSCDIGGQLNWCSKVVLKPASQLSTNWRAPQENQLSGCRVCPARHRCPADGLTPDSLNVLSTCMRASDIMNRGDYLYREGDSADRCFVVRSGVYKTYTQNVVGDEYVTGFYYPGELLGLNGQASGRHSDSAVALDTATACRLLVDDIPNLWSIGAGPAFLRMVGEQQCSGFGQQINLGQSKADARVVGFLIQLATRMRCLRRSEKILPAPMSRTDLANHLGMTLECLSRVLSRFKKAGWIRASRSEIELLKRAELETLACHLT